MVLSVLRILILQKRMHGHPVGLDVWYLLRHFVYFHTLWVWTAKVLAWLRMRRLAWAFTGRLCDKYHNLTSWLKWYSEISYLTEIFTGFKKIKKLFMILFQNLNQNPRTLLPKFYGLYCYQVSLLEYRNVTKFSDRQVWANSADPDQTAPRGVLWSGSTLFAIPSAFFGCISLRKSHLFRVITPNVWVSKI